MAIDLLDIFTKITVAIEFIEFVAAGVIDRYDRFTYIHVQFTVHTFHILFKTHLLRCSPNNHIYVVRTLFLLIAGWRNTTKYTRRSNVRCGVRSWVFGLSGVARSHGPS